MDLLTLIILVLVGCVVVALTQRFIPMPASVRVVFTALAVTVLCCVLLGVAGLGAYNSALIGFVVICLVIYLLETLWFPGPPPRDPGLRSIIYVVLVILLCVWLLYAFGLIGSLRIPLHAPVQR